MRENGRVPQVGNLFEATRHDDIALVNADTKLDATVARLGVVVGHCRLPRGGTSQGIDDTGELDDQAIPGCFDNAASVLGDRRVDHLVAQRLQPP